MTGYCATIYKRNKFEILASGIIPNNIATSRESHIRTMFTALSILNLIDTLNIKRLVIEDYAFSKFAQSRAISCLAEIRGALNFITMATPDLKIETVAPNTSIKSLTGIGKYKSRDEKKAATIKAATKLMHHLFNGGITTRKDTIVDDNEADAIALFHYDRSSDLHFHDKPLALEKLEL